MYNSPIRFVIYLVILLYIDGAYANTVFISESSLKAYSKKTPSSDKADATLISAKIAFSEYQDNFSLGAFASSRYATTKEKAFISIAPVYSPQSNYEIGFKKRFALGLEAKTAINSDTKEFVFSGSKDERTSTYLSMKLSVDLWKNILGKLDKANLDSRSILLKQGEIKKKISNHNFLITLRQLFWQMVANQNAQNISESLLKSAKKQVRDANSRRKNSAADKGEVARYKALASSRLSSLTYLKFQREKLTRSLKRLIPELTDKAIVIKDYDLDRVVGKVMSCINTIKSSEKIPYEHTLYDELITEIKGFHQKQLKITNTYDDIDLKLSTTLSSKGVESNKSESFDETFNGKRTGFEVGVMLTIPLGFSSKTEEQKIKANRLKASYESREIIQELASTHKFIFRSITHLLSTVEAQADSRKNLKIRITDMKRKYHQGRITVSEYINDQDSLFQTELQILESKTMILGVLFNYLGIFTETPCEFNRI
jgi:hypothetical protein